MKSTTHPQSDLSRLPKWAQDRIRLSESRLEEANRKLGEIATVAEDGERGIGWSDHSAGIGAHRRVPSDVIRLTIDKRTWADFRINRDNTIDVNTSFGSSAPMISPSSANSFEIHFVNSP